MSVENFKHIDNDKKLLVWWWWWWWWVVRISRRQISIYKQKDSCPHQKPGFQ
jgi:hypothetical protein